MNEFNQKRRRATLSGRVAPSSVGDRDCSDLPIAENLSVGESNPDIAKPTRMGSRSESRRFEELARALGNATVSNTGETPNPTWNSIRSVRELSSLPRTLEATPGLGQSPSRRLSMKDARPAPRTTTALSAIRGVGLVGLDPGIHDRDVAGEDRQDQTCGGLERLNLGLPVPIADRGRGESMVSTSRGAPGPSSVTRSDGHLPYDVVRPVPTSFPSDPSMVGSYSNALPKTTSQGDRDVHANTNSASFTSMMLPGSVRSSLFGSSLDSAGSDTSGVPNSADYRLPSSTTIGIAAGFAGSFSPGETRAEAKHGDLGGNGAGGSPFPTSSEFATGPASSSSVAQDRSASFDLSKTNELLQQLLDEARKGRQPFLPSSDRNSSF